MQLEKQLEGKKIILRSVCITDATDLVRLASSNLPAVKNFLYFTEISVSQDELVREIDYIADNIFSKDKLLSVIETQQGDIIGTCGLHEIDWHNETVRIGILIFDESQWGKGQATEVLTLLIEYVFSELNLHKIYLNAFTTNERGLKLYKRLGFQEEGRLREEYKIHGRYVDLVRMGLLREEWSKDAS